MRFVLFLLFFVFISFQINRLLAADSPLEEEESVEQKTEKILKISQKLATFYELPLGVDLWEITEDVLQSPLVGASQKQLIQESERRIFLFTYPSDDLMVKGIVSFVPHPATHPLLVLLRGGNGNQAFGILNPGMDLMTLKDYTILTTTYRGGVSEGQDELGGADVNDVQNLVKFIPQLEDKLNVSLQNEKMYLLGQSRGGMEMFLTLGRFPELQTHFTKIVSLSGLLDMREFVTTRPDLKSMFAQEFGLIENVNEEEWINLRNPILVADKINPTLPILIIQGTCDNRVSLEQGYHMVSRLQANGNDVTYWEIEGGIHCLETRHDRAQLILDWLEG